MKKLILILLVALMAAALVACGGPEDTTTTPDTSAPDVTTPTDTAGVTTPDTTKTEDPDKIVETEFYTATLRDFDWVADDIDYSEFDHFGNGSDISNEINRAYQGYAKSYKLRGENGEKSDISSGSVRRLGTVGAVVVKDDAAKKVEIELIPVETRVESSWEKVTARAGSYLMFKFTTNCPTNFYMTVTAEAGSKAYLYEQGDVSTTGSKGTYTGIAKCTVPYTAGKTVYVNICADDAGKTVLTSVPIKITEAKYESPFQLVFQGDWELVRDPNYLPNLIDLFYNVYPRLSARFGVGTEPKKIVFAADKKYDGVAYNAGDRVCVAVDYANKNPSDIGFFAHEITHAMQQYGGKMYYGSGAWWTENMADHGRFRYFHWGYDANNVKIYSMKDPAIRDWGWQPYGQCNVFTAYMDWRYPTTKDENGNIKYGLMDSINFLIKASSTELSDDPYNVNTPFNKKVKEVTGLNCMEEVRLQYVKELDDGTFNFIGFGEYKDNFTTENINGIPNPEYPMNRPVTKGDKTNAALAAPVTEGTNIAKGAKVVEFSGQSTTKDVIENCFDGDPDTKWTSRKGAGGLKCELGGYQHEFVIDLGSVKNFNTYTLLNAGTKENERFNMKEWELLVSKDGTTWISVDYQNDRNDNSVSFQVGEQSAQYVKLRVYRADNGNTGTIRLYEFMLFDA